MLQSLKRRGYHLMIWSSMWTCGSGPGDNGTEAQALGYLAPGPVGRPIARTSAARASSSTSRIRRPRRGGATRSRPSFAANGIQGIKLDRGEEHIPSEATDLWADGRTGREVRNDYPTLQAKIHHDALASVFGGDFLLVSRPAYTGTPQWSTFWGGDIPGSTNFGGGPGTDLGLRSAIISQQRAAFMGIPIWGSDTGGYYEFKDREVFARWIEFSAFSGFMEIGGVGTHAPWMHADDARVRHGADRHLPPLHDAARHAPAVHRRGGRARRRQACRSCVRCRSPTARTASSRTSGTSISSDPTCSWRRCGRWGERSRTVYFPRGRWRSYWDPSQVFTGRRTVTVDVPLDTIPVFVRDGADVPKP